MTKENSEETTTKTTHLAKAILIGLLFLISYLVTFVHINKTSLKEWTPYKNHKKSTKKIMKTYDDTLSSIISDLKNNGLNLYAEKLEQAEVLKKNSIREYNTGKNKLKKEFSFMGYASKRVFWYDFGKSLFTLLPIVVLFILIFNPEIINSLKKLLIIGTFGFLYVSFFWILHNLYAESDFSKLAYSFSFVIGTVLSTIITILLVYFFSWLEKKKQQTQEDLKSIIDSGNELIHTFKKTV